MTTFFAILTPMLTLFFCIAVGFVLTKTKALPESSSKVMAKMENWIFCPALSFVTMIRYCTVDNLAKGGMGVLFGGILVAFAMLTASLLSRVMIRKGGEERNIYSYALAFANGGYVGDPVVLTLFGDEALFYYKLFYLPFSLMIYTWGISILTPANGSKGNTLRRLANPPTVSLFVGLLLGLTGAGAALPPFLISALDSLKNCVGPVAMLLAGATVARYDLVGMLKKKLVYLATLLRLVILPAVQIALLFVLKHVFAALFSVDIGNDIFFLCFFATAAPLGLNTVVFPEAYGGNPETGASMTLISHTACVITIPLLYALAVAIFGAPFGT